MRLFSTPVTPEYVYVIGPSDVVEAGVYNLMAATYCAMVTSAQVELCLGVFSTCIRYGKWGDYYFVKPMHLFRP